MKKTRLVLGFMLIMLLALSTSLTAENQVVTLNTDANSLGGGNSGDFRYAISNVNAGEAISFNISGSDIITISAELSITESMTINGYNLATGNDITVQVTDPGTSLWMVFHINASGKIINISNMTIKGGDISASGGYGGSIYNGAGNLTLTNITVTGSKADYGGGVYTENLGAVTTINNSTVSSCIATDDGGGVYGWGKAIINLDHCIISDNTSGTDGGGVSNENCTINITHCTIRDNSASGDGGGVANHDCGIGYGETSMSIINSTIEGNNSGSSGGGVSNTSSTSSSLSIMIITNTTIHGNTANYAGGGINISFSVITINSSTISGNKAISWNSQSGRSGSGINFSYLGTMTIKNSIVVDNYDDDDYYYFCYDSGPVSYPILNDEGGNIVGYQIFCKNSFLYGWVEQGGFDNTTSILFNYNKSGVLISNPTSWNRNNGSIGGSLNLSSTLANNGGPTQTLALTSGSFAIGVGIWDEEVTTDQRGYSRSNPPTIGAYEFGGTDPTLPVTLSTFTAEFIQNTPTLYWETQSEIDNIGWNI